MTLLGPDGQPIKSRTNSIEGSYARARTNPILGEVAAKWGNGTGGSGYSSLAHQLRLQFDPNRITLADCRMIREHYQVNASITVLTFLIHQASWKLEGGSLKVRTHVEENMRDIWTRLMRSVGTAFWAGFSPNALQWENKDNKVWLTKIKDLPPEECEVHWKKVRGKAPRSSTGGVPAPYVNVFDGISQYGAPHIPRSNAFWYSLLREHNNYYGRRLLVPAVQPWYFSTLMHLYANRYFERFAEPTPVGRAPFDDTVEIGGKKVRGNVVMANMLDMMRNGSSVVLPNSRTPDSYKGESTYDYDINYLESQLRGVDFERYMIRLDEEISLAIFTPLLMLRSADVGSYNLGSVHTNLYLWILNALCADLEEYINHYLIRKMVDFNFGEGVEAPRIHFRKMGVADKETMRSIVTAVIHNGKARPDLDELGQAIGLNLLDMQELTGEEAPPGEGEEGDIQQPTNPDGTRQDRRTGRPDRTKKAPVGTDKVTTIASRMVERVYKQACNAFERGEYAPGWRPSLGFRSQFVEALADEGNVTGAMAYREAERAVASLSGAIEVLDTPDKYRASVESIVGSVVDKALAS